MTGKTKRKKATAKLEKWKRSYKSKRLVERVAWTMNHLLGLTFDNVEFPGLTFKE